jgi:hypothetical protein
MENTVIGKLITCFRQNSKANWRDRGRRRLVQVIVRESAADLRETQGTPTSENHEVKLAIFAPVQNSPLIAVS